ncbi:MAG: hypothetical protein AB8I08_27870 [Sandaracinaceae bacterium]
MRRLHLVVMAFALLACEPAFGWTVSTDGQEPEDARFAVAISSGDCGERGAATFGEPLAPDGSPSAPPLEPGAYCFEALGYVQAEVSPETNGFACRTLAVARETRRLPRDRDPLDSRLVFGDSDPAEPDAGPSPDPSQLLEGTDALLRDVVGCNPACDVERCVCSRSCRDEAPACPAPVQVRSLVMGDHFVCGLTRDRSGLLCWGDGEGGPPSDPDFGLSEGLAEQVGVARYFSVEELLGPFAEDLLRGGPASILAFDASGDNLCINTERFTRCLGRSPFNDEGGGPTAPSRVVTGDSLFCIGESTGICFVYGELGSTTTASAVGMATPSLFDGVQELVAEGDYVCGVVNGVIRCATRAAPCGSCDVHSICDVDLGLCRADDIRVPLSRFFRLAAGGGRVCGVTSARGVHCFTLGEEQPRIGPRPLQHEPDGAFLRALDVSLGDAHFCVRRPEGDVQCAPHPAEGHDVPTLTPFPAENIDSFEAGPDGITCAVLSETQEVVCHQLPEFVEDGPPHPLLGVGHTRIRTLDEHRPVCP